MEAKRYANTYPHLTELTCGEFYVRSVHVYAELLLLVREYMKIQAPVVVDKWSIADLCV